jgi:hypothetical protein
MLLENGTLPPSARLSIKAIYERIRETESFRGSYGSVSDYARSIRPDDVCIWEYAYDLLTSLEKKRAIDSLFLLSRADPPVISRSRTEQFFRDAGRVINIAPAISLGTRHRGICRRCCTRVLLSITMPLPGETLPGR